MKSVYFKLKWEEFLNLINVVKEDIYKEIPKDEEKKNADIHDRLMYSLKNQMDNFNEEDAVKMFDAINSMENNMTQNQPVVIDANILQNQVFNALMQEVHKTVLQNPGFDINMIMNGNQNKPEKTKIPNEQERMIKLKEFISQNPFFFLYNKSNIFKIFSADEYRKIIKLPEGFLAT